MMEYWNDGIENRGTTIRFGVGKCSLPIHRRIRVGRKTHAEENTVLANGMALAIKRNTDQFSQRDA